VAADDTQARPVRGPCRRGWGLAMKLAAFLACLLTEHVCDLSDLHRVSDERVTCHCSRCGRVLRATHGLALRCRWTDTKRHQLRRARGQGA